MKLKTILIAILIFIFFVLWAASTYTVPDIHKEDYSIKYSEQLNKLFDGSYTISNRRTVSGIRNPEGPKYYYRYYEWDISYKDIYGNSHNVTLSNKERFGRQVYCWMIEQIKQYYFSSFFEELNLGTSLAFTYGTTQPNSSSKEMGEAEEINTQYCQKLFENIEQGKSKICLYNFDYANAFNELMIYFHISISVDPVTFEKPIDFVIAQIEETISTISDYTGEKYNLYIVLEPTRNINDATVRKCIWRSVNGELRKSFLNVDQSNSFYQYQWDIYHLYKERMINYFS